MERDVSNRVAEFIASLNMSQYAFSKASGVPVSTVNSVVTGRGKPSFDFLARVSHSFPQLNLEWIVLGEGTMLKSVSSPIPVLHEEPLSWEVLKRQEAQLELQRANYRALMTMLEDAMDREKHLMSQLLELKEKSLGIS